MCVHLRKYKALALIQVSSRSLVDLCQIWFLVRRCFWPIQSHLHSCLFSRCVKKNKLLLNMQVNGNGCEDSSSRYHVTPARTPGATPGAPTAPYTLPATPTLLEERSVMKSESCICLYVAAGVKSQISTVLELFSTKESKDIHQSVCMLLAFGHLDVFFSC